MMLTNKTNLREIIQKKKQLNLAFAVYGSVDPCESLNPIIELIKENDIHESMSLCSGTALNI